MSQVSVAYVQGISGTLVLPAQSPYDRQMLRERIEMLSGRGWTLMFGPRGTRWTITQRPPGNPRCTTCTHRVGRVSYTRGDDAAVACIDCVMQPPAIGSEDVRESIHE